MRGRTLEYSYSQIVHLFNMILLCAVLSFTNSHADPWTQNLCNSTLTLFLKMPTLSRLGIPTSLGTGRAKMLYLGA